MVQGTRRIIIDKIIICIALLHQEFANDPLTANVVSDIAFIMTDF